ncbi:MAG TPA: ATP-binding cassette domain-containing protein [Bryobacteraceae bacterium]|nr:ATP-binding cassette domain-containing protein [Bryobacteraceae bacterium]
MIQVQNLVKSFDNRPALRSLSFRAPDGAITGLLGANGAGKTTTLRMICGVLQPESGSVTVDPAGTGALLDHMGIYPRLTVRENLAYFGMLRGMPPAMLAERIDHVLATLGLRTIADRRTAGFSQGERMKTALGRAILHAPKSLLLDEPTNGLDVPTVRSLRELLRRWRDAGACVVFSSHVLEDVRALCDVGDGRDRRRRRRIGGALAAARHAVVGYSHMVVHRRRLGVPADDLARPLVARRHRHGGVRGLVHQTVPRPACGHVVWRGTLRL